MTFDEYQKQAMRTAGEHGAMSMTYAALAIAGEAGELVELIKKFQFHGQVLELDRLMEEAGDVLWGLAYLTSRAGIPLEEIAKKNVEKLQRRYPNGFTRDGGIR